MVTAVVAACAVLLASGLTLLTLRRARRESERRLELVLVRIDSHLDAISASVVQAIDRVVNAQADAGPAVLTLDFDALVDALVAEVAAHTGADAVVFRGEGPGGRPVVASLGPGVDTELLERAFAPPDARPFRAATIDWTYSPAGEPNDELFHSALVAPLGSSAGIPGTLVAYSTAPDAFGPEHTREVHELLAGFATGLQNARRFAEVEARILVDPATGVANRRGYEVELGREVARAHRTGRPLSVVLVGIENGAETTTAGGGVNGVGEFARLLTRITRKSDISCRRGDREFAILLPGTREAGATMLTTRLREEAKRAFGAGQSTFTVGLAEWRPNESLEALEARAEAALTVPSEAPSPAEEGPPVPTPSTEARSDRREPSPPLHAEPTDVLRLDALDTLTHEARDAHRFGRSLTLVALDIGGLEEISERLGREAADEVLSEVARRLDESVGGGSVHRLGPGEFALLLAGSTIDDAEALLGTLHGPPDGDDETAGVVLSAGITELAEDDDAPTALGRAEHALWQAKQAGLGTVVIALPRRRKPRIE
jgi:diguanylate cyclase (GGDEF)-like protein